MIKTLSYAVTGQHIETTETAMLVAGTVNEYTARFSFDADWDGYQRVAVFNADGTEREQLLIDDACAVPWEVLLTGAYLKVGVYGTRDGSRLPTIWTSHRQYIHDGAGPTDEAADPSPTLVEQLLGRIGDPANLKTEDKSSLVAAINEVWSSGGSGGSSVTDAAINEDGHLIITLSTGKEIDAGYAVGPAGSNGKDGADGKSAYQYAKDGGYTGTAAEFAAKMAAEIPEVDATLKESGKAADAKATGDAISSLSEEMLTDAELSNAVDNALAQAKESGEFNGKDGITPTIGENGNWYLGETDTSKPSRGETGPQGPPGTDASVTAANVAAAMGLSGLAADDQIMVSAVDADGKPTGWRKKYRDMLNVRDFGAKGDSTTDDTAAIQAALDAASTRGISAVLFPTGTYKVSATTADNNFFAALTVHSGQRLIFDAATLQLTANGYDFYAVLNIHNVNNITVEGGLTIIGDRESHTATTGESGHGIRIVNSHNVHVSDVFIQYTWGDGVCVGGNGTMEEISENVTLERINTYKCSRNGLSIIEADGVTVRDCEFSYTDRTDPQYGIDVEPNLGTATNIMIDNVKMLNNGIGSFSLYVKKATMDGIISLRNIETDSKTIVYTSGDGGGKFDVSVDGWRHSQKSGATSATLRFSGDGNLRVKNLKLSNKSGERVLYLFDAKNISIDGVNVDDDPSVSIKGTLSIESSVSLENVIINGFLSRNPNEATYSGGTEIRLSNAQDRIVNLNDYLTTGGSSEKYNLLMCDRELVLNTDLSAKARIYIKPSYGDINPVRVVNKTSGTQIYLYTTVSNNIKFYGDIVEKESANDCTLLPWHSYDVYPMLARGLVYVRCLDMSIPQNVSDLTNDSGYQTAEQVESTVTGKGYQTAEQVSAAITAVVGAAMEASY